MKIGKFLLIIIITTFNLTCFKNCELFKESTTQIHGIDISHYQDDKSQIDWQTVSNRNQRDMVNLRGPLRRLHRCAIPL